MLRIGEVTDTFLPIVDGVGRVVQAYAETLTEMGHKVTVISPLYNAGYQGELPYQLIEFKGTTVPGYKQYKVGEPIWDSRYRQQMRTVSLDLVHAHSPFTAGSEGLRLASQRKLPLVGSFHSKYYDDFLKATRSESLARLGLRIVVNFYNRCDEVWAVSRNTADVLKEYGYEGDIQIMPNGASLREASPSDVAEVTRRWSLQDDPLILFVGQMDWKKNILTVLEACALLKERGQTFRLILAGQGIDMLDIEQKMHDLHLTDRAQMVGHITDASLLDGLYARSSLFIFPSLYDAAPMVVREAAVMGVPSVMVRGSTAAEAIRDGKNGFLCENTPTDLARVIADALRDPDRLREVGRAARETIPVPWKKVMEFAVERYTRLVALGHEGKLKDKRSRLI